MKSDSLGNRMKGYEEVSSVKLTKRTPVIIRIDGRAFHTLTRGMKRPFDDSLIHCMTETTRLLVKNIEGCEFGYTQSDEISLLLTDYKRINTQSWFDNKVQKICSIAASMATAFFNKEFVEFFPAKGLAFFDARAYNVPKEEVVNYFLWRQQDCTRNSIQMVGRAHFSQKELHQKSCDEIQEMLFSQKGINWNDIETYKKRGTSVYKVEKYIIFKSSLNPGDPCPKCKTPITSSNMASPIRQFVDCPKCWKVNGENVIYTAPKRTEYFIDRDIPIFTQDRNFIQKWVDVEEKE